jgi:hypothetical protein
MAIVFPKRYRRSGKCRKCLDCLARRHVRRSRARPGMLAFVPNQDVRRSKILVESRRGEEVGRKDPSSTAAIFEVKQLLREIDQLR